MWSLTAPSPIAVEKEQDRIAFVSFSSKVPCANGKGWLVILCFLRALLEKHTSTAENE
jgi:hypothetical protein